MRSYGPRIAELVDCHRPTSGKHICDSHARITDRDDVDRKLSSSEIGAAVEAFEEFEPAPFVSGEIRDPRRDAPIAILVALTTATFLYFSVQYIVIHTLPTATTATKPVANAAQHFLGPFVRRSDFNCGRLNKVP